MWMDKGAIKAYPRLAQQLQLLQAKKLKANSPRVWDALVKYSTDAGEVEKALVWSNNPRVRVSSNWFTGPRRTEACAWNEPINKDSITLARRLVTALERSVWDGDTKTVSRHIEITVLHELVHWVRDEVGETDMWYGDNPDDPALEAGTEFEKEAYGRQYCTKDDVDAMDFMYP